MLEDLHWGDRPTARFVDAALRDLARCPFMVVATARPEVHDLFPKLWSDRRVHEIRLGELSRKASERLVRQVLGDGVDAAAAARIVTLADGHAFYLEELIRAVADGRGTSLPETVLAMVEARLGALPGDARRALRAASVFGEVLWSGGVAALLGGAGAADAEALLGTLVSREILTPHAESRFPGEEELAFGHALLREGAYAMLTEADRALGHRRAGLWLEQAGENDPIVLAEHFARGLEPARAAAHYLRAAELSHQGGDTQATMERAERGLACGGPPSLDAAFQGLLAESYGWCNRWDLAARYAEAAMRVAPPESPAWLRSVPAKLGIAYHPGALDAFTRTMAVIERVEPSRENAGFLSFGFTVGSYLLYWGGRRDLIEAPLRQQRRVAEHDVLARAWMHLIQAWYVSGALEDPHAALLHAEAGRADFLAVGHHRGGRMIQCALGMNAWFLGARERAERELYETMDADQELGPVASHRTMFLAQILAERGALDEARLLSTRLCEAGRALGLPTVEGRGCWALADVLHRSGDLELAAGEALRAIERLTIAPLDQTGATAALAVIRLAQGRATEALAAAEVAAARCEALGVHGFRGGLVRLAHAEALEATGAHAPARRILDGARDRLLAVAARIADPELRRSFLEDVPENARTLALAGAPLCSVGPI